MSYITNSIKNNQIWKNEESKLNLKYIFSSRLYSKQDHYYYSRESEENF